MMRIVWKKDASDLALEDVHFLVTNEVRNEINGRRRLHDPKEVVHAVVNGQWGPPYMPRPFPSGIWEILSVEDTSDPEFAPVKIKTNARKPVTVWALDERGGYDHPTDETVDDGGYHLHWAEKSRTTLGCGRVGTDTPDQVLSLARIIREAFSRGGFLSTVLAWAPTGAILSIHRQHTARRVIRAILTSMNDGLRSTP